MEVKAASMARQESPRWRENRWTRDRCRCRDADRFRQTKSSTVGGDLSIGVPEKEFRI